MESVSWLLKKMGSPFSRNLEGMDTDVDQGEEKTSDTVLTQGSEASRSEAGSQLLTQESPQSYSDGENLGPSLEASVGVDQKQEAATGKSASPQDSAETESTTFNGTYNMTQANGNFIVEEAGRNDGSDEDDVGDYSSFLLTQPEDNTAKHSDGYAHADVLDGDQSGGDALDTDPLPSDTADADSLITPKRQSSQMASEDGSSSEESDDSSTDYESQEETPIMERRRARIERNVEKLRDLELIPKDKAQTHVTPKYSPTEDMQQPDTPTGMLFAASGDQGATTCPPNAANVDDLYDRYPDRQFQIKMLLSLIGSAMDQAAVMDQDSFIPSPIFVSGASGTGKTSIVRDVMDCLKNHYSSSSDSCSMRPNVGTAYVNCATEEPASIEAVLESAYFQLSPRSQKSKRSKRKRKRKTKPEESIHKAKELKTESKLSGFDFRSPLAKAIMMYDENNDNEYDAENVAEMEDKVEESRTSHGAAGLHSPAAEPQETQPRRSTRSTTVNRPSGIVARSVERVKDESIRKSEPVTNSHGAALVFGRVLAPMFGFSNSSSGQGKPGAAVMVLDHADRLFSLSSRKTVEPNNFLAQLLLLPKVAQLNLTIIIVSRSSLLDCSRINNTSSVEKSLGTVADGTAPIRVHFPAYRGKMTFIRVLKQPSMLERIVGKQDIPSSEDGSRGKFRQSAMDSFLDTLVQSLSSVTRDLRELVHMGRMLWPAYTMPLHPHRISETIETARRRLAARMQSGASRKDESVQDAQTDAPDKLQKEILAILDEAMLPQMKTFLDEGLFMMKGDDMHLSSSKGGTSSSNTSSKDSSRSDLPFLSKCLLLAAFVCQTNKPDKDKSLFSIHRTGKTGARKGQRAKDNEADALAYGSGSLEQQRLKMLRPRLFPLERMLSVFVNMVGLINGEEKLRVATNASDSRDVLRSMGSSCFFDSLAQLREIGLIHEVQGTSIGGGDGQNTFDGINLTTPKYWCDLSGEEAEALAADVDLPLGSFLM